MLFENHYYFFECSISGSFPYSIYSTFDLSCSLIAPEIEFAVAIPNRYGSTKGLHFQSFTFSLRYLIFAYSSGKQ
jgi:hypothetical protein